MAVKIPEKTAHAYLEGNELVLEDFRESDPDVVGFVREADEPETAVHRCLTMGAASSASLARRSTPSWSSTGSRR